MPDRISQGFQRFFQMLGADRAADGRPVGDVLQPILDVSGWYRDGGPLPPGTSLYHVRLTSPAPAAANHGAVGIKAEERPVIIEYLVGMVLLKAIDYSIRPGEEGGLFSAWLGAGPVTLAPQSYIGAEPNAFIRTSAAGGGVTPAALAILRDTADPMTTGFQAQALPSGIGGLIYLTPGAHAVFYSTAINDTCDLSIAVRELPAPDERP